MEQLSDMALRRTYGARHCECTLAGEITSFCSARFCLKNGSFWLDGGHIRMREKRWRPGRKKTRRSNAICGMMARKDMAGFLPRSPRIWPDSPLLPCRKR